MDFEQEVRTRDEVRALYETVINDPAVARYRGYADGCSYGWDAVSDDWRCVAGEVWFANPSFEEEAALRRQLAYWRARAEKAEIAAAQAAAERDATREAWEALRRKICAVRAVRKNETA